MTQMTQPDVSGTAQAEPSTRDKMQETAQQVGEKAQEVKGQAGEQIRTQLDTRSTQAGEQITASANALRQAGEQLRGEQQELPAKLATQAADRADQLGRYLTQADADRMLRDIESFGRRQPWVAVAGGVVLGFFASRFVKASSSRRYEQSGTNGYDGRLPGRTQTEIPGTPAMASFGEERFLAGSGELPPLSAGGVTDAQSNR
jgi:ElaB/YqjD/DUF883 family membrane-anchored ribosome-binding protein